MTSHNDPTSVQPQPRRTADERHSTLDEFEERWRDRQPFFESRGYMFRPRLRPSWIPSWRSSGEHPMYAEDGVALPLRTELIDATRIEDGKLVYIKRIRTGDTETQIATMLSSPELRQDPRNHAVPILEVIQDDEDLSISYLVMPFLRPIDNPAFESVDELLDFGDQILEGLVFLHEHDVAHRDCSSGNLLMDATSMYPQGFHPVNLAAQPSFHGRASYVSRSSAPKPVRYFYVDFGYSVHIPPSAPEKLVVGDLGRDQAPPELSAEVPYDPFKLDIFLIGNVFRKQFYQKYTNVDFLVPFIISMTERDPAVRPSASEALQQWKTIRSNVSIWKHWMASLEVGFRTQMKCSLR
ncbi:unnamed protein product [Somion occarium]|uniref:Protein kinase domain-containing protein n=1 Tax=Somion occarium TaxID=3059160 RepID=A0ABP1D799_9APHY